MNVLAFDPGGTTGICLQNEHKVLQVTDTKNIHEWLEKFATPIAGQIDHVVIEEYEQRPHQQAINTGRKGRTQSLYTIEVIGAIKGWCARNGKQFTMYDTKLKPAQCKMTQVFPKKMPKAIEHKWDAFNHGRYYLIQQGLALTSLEAQKKAEGKL